MGGKEGEGGQTSGRGVDKVEELVGGGGRGCHFG